MAKPTKDGSPADPMGPPVGEEAELRKAAADLRWSSLEATEDQPAVWRLIVLEPISAAWAARHAKLEAERDQGADPEGDPFLNDRLDNLSAGEHTQAGAGSFVLANGSMSSGQSDEGTIRSNLIEVEPVLANEKRGRESFS